MMTEFWGGLTVGVLLLWPVALVALGLLDAIRTGRWVTALDICEHGGDPSMPFPRWRPTWRCPKCGGLWVRKYVAKVVPNRVLWWAHRRRAPRERAR